MRPSRLLPAAALLAAATLAAANAMDERVVEAYYPEGPLWHDGHLYFAEMRADRVTVTEGQDKRSFFEKNGCGPTAIAPYGEGFLILCHLDAQILAVDEDGQVLRSWNRDDGGMRLTNPNDASADGNGGVYFSDPGRFAHTDKPQGRIMHLSTDGALRSVAGLLNYPNGVHVRGGALYVSEHLGRRILRYDIEPDGKLGAMRIFADLSRIPPQTRWQSAYALAGPDGLEFGPDGALYVAIYGEGDLLKLSQKGEVLHTIETPTRFLTNIAFGDSGVASTGTFDNSAPPYRGEVRIQSSLPGSAGE